MPDYAPVPRADHAGASSLFGSDVIRIGHEETRRLLLRDNDPAKPPPEVTFADYRTLQIGGERIELAWHGANHSPDNIYIHFPDHSTLMLVDIVLPGWVPFYGVKSALGTVDPTPYFQKYGDNLWAAVRGFLDAVSESAAAPVIEKYTGVLGAVDVFTVPTAFSILESIRLDLGYRMDVRP